MGRHGDGWHNAAEAYYGTPAWNVRARPVPLTLYEMSDGSLTSSFSVLLV